MRKHVSCCTAISSRSQSADVKPGPRGRIAGIQCAIGQALRHLRLQHEHRSTFVRKRDILGPRLVRPESPSAPSPHRSQGDIIASSFSRELCGQPNAGGLGDDKHAILSVVIVRLDQGLSTARESEHTPPPNLNSLKPTSTRFTWPPCPVSLGEAGQRLLRQRSD
jgi:hypothetical protein